MERGGGARRQNGGTQRPTAVTVYIIISSYDYFAFCLPTGARRGQSSKAYLLFSVKATRPHRLGDLFQAVAPKVDGGGGERGQRFRKTGFASTRPR